MGQHWKEALAGYINDKIYHHLHIPQIILYIYVTYPNTPSDIFSKSQKALFPFSSGHCEIYSHCTVPHTGSWRTLSDSEIPDIQCNISGNEPAPPQSAYRFPELLSYP